jgi:hypothetical protein
MHDGELLLTSSGLDSECSYIVDSTRIACIQKYMTFQIVQIVQIMSLNAIDARQKALVREILAHDSFQCHIHHQGSRPHVTQLSIACYDKRELG